MLIIAAAPRATGRGRRRESDWLERILIGVHGRSGGKCGPFSPVGSVVRGRLSRPFSHQQKRGKRRGEKRRKKRIVLQSNLRQLFVETGSRSRARGGGKGEESERGPNFLSSAATPTRELESRSKIGCIQRSFFCLNTRGYRPSDGVGLARSSHFSAGESQSARRLPSSGWT